MVISRIFVILFFTLLSKSVFAAVVTTSIRSDFINIKRHDEAVYLSGHVVVEREDFNILADHMRIYYDEGKKVDDSTKNQDEDEDEINKDENVDEEDVSEEDVSEENMIEEDTNGETKTKKKKKKKIVTSIEHSTIKKILANDHIKIFNAEFVATGDIGFYNPKGEIFILEKNVILNRGLSIAHGEKFIYNLKTKKGNLVGNSSEQKKTGDNRVIVIIDDSNTSQSKKNENKKAKNE